MCYTKIPCYSDVRYNEVELFFYFKAQSDDDDVDEVQVGADTGGFMDEFFAQVSMHSMYHVFS